MLVRRAEVERFEGNTVSPMALHLPDTEGGATARRRASRTYRRGTNCDAFYAALTRWIRDPDVPGSRYARMVRGA